MGTCQACEGTGTRCLPFADDIEEYPCPCCKPWPQGFGGEQCRGRWVIAPSPPNTPAVYFGWGIGPLIT